MRIIIELEDGRICKINAGDQLDLGSEGLICYFPEPEAEVVRTFTKVNQERTQRVISFVKDKTIKQIRSGEIQL